MITIIDRDHSNTTVRWHLNPSINRQRCGSEAEDIVSIQRRLHGSFEIELNSGSGASTPACKQAMQLGNWLMPCESMRHKLVDTNESATIAALLLGTPCLSIIVCTRACVKLGSVRTISNRLVSRLPVV